MNFEAFGWPTEIAPVSCAMAYLVAHPAATYDDVTEFLAQDWEWALNVPLVMDTVVCVLARKTMVQ